MSDEHEAEHLARLKRLVSQLDAAKTAAQETIDHITNAKHQTDRIATDDQRVHGTSSKPSRNRRRSTRR